MALAGITTVGEFHYLHHDPAGRPYADPNRMGEALAEAAGQAGVRLTLLDTCYLRAGLDGRPLADVQVRFGDGDADGWAERAGALRDRPGLRIGAAVHSVRAVNPAAMATVAAWAASRSAPLHLHLSRQRAENEACLAPPAAPRPLWPSRPGCWASAPPPCTPPTSPARTWPASAPPAPPPASARPPNATWPTGSGRPGRWPTPAARSPSAPTAMP